MICWVSFCCLFREGPRHGYAAVVASFTPLVLLDSATGVIGLNRTWSRIQETFLGILIYLAIDNLILPYRMYPILKSGKNNDHIYVTIYICIYLNIDLYSY